MEDYVRMKEPSVAEGQELLEKIKIDANCWELKSWKKSSNPADGL